MSQAGTFETSHESWEMSPTGLCQDFESAFGHCAFALTAYLETKERTLAPTNDMTTSEEMFAVLVASLGNDIKDYASFLQEAFPKTAEDILKKSNGRAVVLMNAVVRAFNIKRHQCLDALKRRGSTVAVLQDIAQTMDALYETIGRTDVSFADRVMRLKEVSL